VSRREKSLGRASRRAGLTFAYYDEPTWLLLLVIAVELAVMIICLLIVIVALW
jgi:hypothetical protein